MLSHHERAVHAAPLSHELQGRPVSRHGRPRRGKEAHERGDRRRRGGKVGYNSDRMDVGRVYRRVHTILGPR